MTKITDLHTNWMHDPEYRAAYDALEDEFALAAALIEARATSWIDPRLACTAYAHHAIRCRKA